MSPYLAWAVTPQLIACVCNDALLAWMDAVIPRLNVLTSCHGSWYPCQVRSTYAWTSAPSLEECSHGVQHSYLGLTQPCMG